MMMVEAREMPSKKYAVFGGATPVICYWPGRKPKKWCVGRGPQSSPPENDGLFLAGPEGPEKSQKPTQLRNRFDIIIDGLASLTMAQLSATETDGADQGVPGIW